VTAPHGPGAEDAPRGPAGSPGLVAVLAGAAVLFALTTDWSWPVGLAIAGAGVAGSIAVRAAGTGLGRELAAVPAAAALGTLACEGPATAVPDLLGGLAAVALLAWVADDPARAPGGLGRAVPTLVLLVLFVAVAWAGALFWPSGTSLIGVGAALLVLVTVAVAFLFGRPDLFDREAPATA
jgi:hypothetical protein